MARDSPLGLERRKRFQWALTGSRIDLAKEAITGGDLQQLLPIATDGTSELEIRARAGLAPDDVVFVVHGIRDKGYWTRKIARVVVATGQRLGREVVAVAPSYGYFAMLPFLLPWTRRAKVEWLLDMYVTVRCWHPDAKVSFIGHSNGTYILAGAIESCPAVHFKNVVFAGSVVRSNFEWSRYLDRHQIGRVLNYVATADWVVAIFPRLLQILRLQDVGGAGHDGFLHDPVRVTDVEYVSGRHSAALDEEHWDDIAHFVFDGQPPDRQTTVRHPLVVVAAHVALLIWIALATLAVLPLYFFLTTLGFPEVTGLLWLESWKVAAASNVPAWLLAGALMGWLRMLSGVLTRL